MRPNAGDHRWRTAAVVLLCALPALLMPSVAEAKRVRYSGQTSQGMRVVLQTNAKGKAHHFAISFDPTCHHSDWKHLEQKFGAPFRKADFSGFTDGGAYKQRYTNVDTVGKVRTHVEGVRLDGDRLQGTFRYKVRYFADGEQFNSCRTRTIRWFVHR
jgi:hypothetical protein